MLKNAMLVPERTFRKLTTAKRIYDLTLPLEEIPVVYDFSREQLEDAIAQLLTFAEIQEVAELIIELGIYLNEQK
jgi:hypothetical protein